MGRTTRSDDRACRGFDAPQPRERMDTPLVIVGEAYFFNREFDIVVSKLLLTVQDNPDAPPAYRTLAACYAHMVRLDEARTVITVLCADAQITLGPTLGAPG